MRGKFLNLYGTVWYGTVQYGTVWYGRVRYGMVWYGKFRYGMVWCGTVWEGHLKAHSLAQLSTSPVQCWPLITLCAVPSNTVKQIYLGLTWHVQDCANLLWEHQNCGRGFGETNNYTSTRNSDMQKGIASCTTTHT